MDCQFHAVLLLYRFAERKNFLESQHDTVEYETDDADGKYRNHDAAERVGTAVLEFIPDKLTQARILRQHFRRNQYHPTHTQRQPHTSKDIR